MLVHRRNKAIGPDFVNMFVVPQIGGEQAKALLAKPPRILAKRRDVLKVQLYYLPNYVFRVDMQNRKLKEHSMKICLDGIEGHFAFYDETELAEHPVWPGQCIDAKISSDVALQRGGEEFRRMILQQSLKKRDEISIKTIVFERKIFYPFWVGYFERKGAYDFDAVDAVSGERQGAKMRSVFMKAILATE